MQKPSICKIYILGKVGLEKPRIELRMRFKRKMWCLKNHDILQLGKLRRTDHYLLQAQVVPYAVFLIIAHVEVPNLYFKVKLEAFIELIKLKSHGTTICLAILARLLFYLSTEVLNRRASI